MLSYFQDITDGILIKNSPKISLFLGGCEGEELLHVQFDHLPLPAGQALQQSGLDAVSFELRHAEDHGLLGLQSEDGLVDHPLSYSLHHFVVLQQDRFKLFGQSVLEEDLGLSGQVAVEHRQDSCHLAPLALRQVLAFNAEEVLQEFSRHGEEFLRGVSEVLGQQGEGEEEFVLQLLAGVLFESPGEGDKVVHDVAEQGGFLCQQGSLSLAEDPQQQGEALVELTAAQ